MQILKFRAFSSNDSQGFIILKHGPLPEIILQDILFQLFEPLFPNIHCPEIYFFTSTDEILEVSQLTTTRDYIYVHFLERVDSYVRQERIHQKLKICSLEAMSQGIEFQGTNLYIFSEKQYLMYGKNVFRETLMKRIKQISLKQDQKSIKYKEYIRQLQQLKDNFQMMKLKDQIKDTVQKYKEKVADLEFNYSRYLNIKAILGRVLKNSGIQIQSISHLK